MLGVFCLLCKCGAVLRGHGHRAGYLENAGLNQNLDPIGGASPSISDDLRDPPGNHRNVEQKSKRPPKAMPSGAA